LIEKELLFVISNYLFHKQNIEHLISNQSQCHLLPIDTGALRNIILPGDHGLAHAGHVCLSHVLSCIDLYVRDHALPRVGGGLHPLKLLGTFLLLDAVGLSAELLLFLTVSCPLSELVLAIQASLMSGLLLILLFLKELSRAGLLLLFNLSHSLSLLLIHIIIEGNV